MPGQTYRNYQVLFQRFKLKCQRKQAMRNAQFTPTCTDLNRDLICVPDTLPPMIQRCKGGLTNNLAGRGVCKRERTIGALRNPQQELMLSFWNACKRTQSTINLQRGDQRRRAETLQN